MAKKSKKSSAKVKGGFLNSFRNNSDFDGIPTSSSALTFECNVTRRCSTPATKKQNDITNQHTEWLSESAVSTIVTSQTSSSKISTVRSMIKDLGNKILSRKQSDFTSEQDLKFEEKDSSNGGFLGSKTLQQLSSKKSPEGKTNSDKKSEPSELDDSEFLGESAKKENSVTPESQSGEQKPESEEIERSQSVDRGITVTCIKVNTQSQNGKIKYSDSENCVSIGGRTPTKTALKSTPKANFIKYKKLEHSEGDHLIPFAKLGENLHTKTTPDITSAQRGRETGQLTLTKKLPPCSKKLLHNKLEHSDGVGIVESESEVNFRNYLNTPPPSRLAKYKINMLDQSDGGQCKSLGHKTPKKVFTKTPPNEFFGTNSDNNSVGSQPESSCHRTPVKIFKGLPGGIIKTPPQLNATTPPLPTFEKEESFMSQLANGDITDGAKFIKGDQVMSAMAPEFVGFIGQLDMFNGQNIFESEKYDKDFSGSDLGFSFSHDN